ncbi:MAG: hypothetical protein IT372_04450 [Polyangiaceae bacterium]|nr:hypothetical protein [Polyangiaceae bacterium]
MTRTSITRARRLAVLLAFAAGLAAAPSGCSSPGPAPDAGASVDLGPIPAPAGLIAEVYLPTPDTTWAKARLAVSGPALFLPASAGALAANLLGLPITIASEIDGAVPALGAIVDAGTTTAAAKPGDPGRPRAVLGLHVKAGDRFIDQLTRAPGARWQSRVDPASSITLLEPGAPAPAGSAAPTEPTAASRGRLAMGVLGNYLLIAPDLDDLLRVGPYVARTLPRSPVPKEDLAIEVPRPAIDGPILTAARGTWERLRGAAASAAGPTGDALAIAPMIDAWLEILADLDHARVTLTLDESAHLRLAGSPRPGNGPATRAVADAAVGDVKPLLDLPADTLLGLLIREAPAARAAGIDRQVGAVARLLGKDLPAKDRDKLATSLRALSDARGDWFAAGLRFDSVGPTAYVRAAARDDAALSSALKDLVALVKLPAVKAYLSGEHLEITSGKTVVERLPGDVQRLRFERIEDKEKPRKDLPLEASTIPRTIDLLYLVQGGVLLASAGYDPQEGLRRALAAPAGQSLATVPPFQAALAPLGPDTSFALVLDPLRLVATRAGRPGAADPAPVVIAAGAAPAPPSLWLRADIAVSAIRDLVRYRGAL